MTNGDRTVLRITADELARRPGGPASGPTADAGAPGGARKRMFMAGRMGPNAARIRYGGRARPPVPGPWDLALVVSPR